jgi:L-fuconolactonase
VPDFPIVDAHVHLYDPANLPYAWLGGVPAINKAHLPSDFDRLTAPVKVDGIVFVEVDVDDPRHLDEARWVEALGRSDSRIRALVAGMPLEKGLSIEPDIAEYAKLPHARAVRRLMQKHAGEPGWSLQPDFVAAMKLLPKYDLTFDLCIFHNQMRETIELVEKCPEVRFMLDHIGKPGIREGLTQPWRAEMRELAALPNVECKISGVVTEADHTGWTYDQGRALRRAFDRDVRLRSGRLRRRLAGLGTGDALCRLGRRRRPGGRGRERLREAEALPRERDPLLSHVRTRASGDS